MSGLPRGAPGSRIRVRSGPNPEVEDARRDEPGTVTNQMYTQSPTRKLLRSRDDRMVAGVCGGIARLFGVDAAIVRVLLVIATILGIGTGALVYLACWLIIPQEV